MLQLSFQEWTQGIQDTLNIKKRGDIAFRDEDFEAAIDNYTQVLSLLRSYSVLYNKADSFIVCIALQLIGVMVIPSVTVFARRSFCYLMSDSDQSAAALRDAMQAQATFTDCPTGLYMQSVALTRLNLHSDATEMLNQASQLEVKWIQKSEEEEMERQKKSNDASHSDGGETFSFPTILLNS
jgi:BR-signaling kinase